MSDPEIPFVVKWGKETVELKLHLSVLKTENGSKALKSELSERTGVPMDRMKLMAKTKNLWKGVLKDDVDLSGLDWNTAAAGNGSSIHLLLMGSATELGQPKTKTVFLEDLPEEEVAKVLEPAGLENLGNTCYLNSVTQCLRAVPQLRKPLQDYRALSQQQNSVSSMFVAALRDTYHQLDRSVKPIPPVLLVQTTKMAFPQFAQRSPQTGAPMQQDAEEFYSGLLTVASTELWSRPPIPKKYFSASSKSKKNKNTNIATTNSSSNEFMSEEELKGATNLIDAAFGLQVQQVLTCDEAPEAETAVISYDLQRKLVCNIQGGAVPATTSATSATQPATVVTSATVAAAAGTTSSANIQNVNHISEGIALSLSGKIEKHSDVLGRNAMWTKTQRISRLPPVLVVQFGRFYWKATPESSDHAGVKCKVMKPVAFGTVLDMYDFCASDLQGILKVARDQAAKDEEDRVNRKLKGELTENTTAASEGDKMQIEGDTTAVAAATAAAAEENEEEDEDLKAALAMSMMETETTSTTKAPVGVAGPGLPENFQGLYELFAVVTHKGRDADGGHYMAWVKADHDDDDNDDKKDGTTAAAKQRPKIANTDTVNEDWYVFDDDEVSPCKTEDVLKLKGGGDWHMSYLNFYRAKK